MTKFKNLTELQEWLNKNVHQVMNRSAELERLLAEEMSQAVWDIVYSEHYPKVYERRGDIEGLSDVRNMQITSVETEGRRVKLTFENLTQGNDNMANEFITDMIVEGIKDKWNNPDGVWSEPRDFVRETARRLKENPEELAEVIKNGLAKKGIKFNV